MYNEINRNKFVSAVIVFLFFVFVVIVLFFFGYIYDYGWLGVIMGLVVSLPTTLIGYYFSDQMVLSMAGATEVKRVDNKELYNLVDNLAITAGLPKPKVFIINDFAMNAFATGRDPNHAVVAVTSGLLKSLTKTELEGVIAHELSHIKNFDTRLSTILVIFVGLIVILAEWFVRLGRFGFGKSKENQGGGLLAIFGLVVIIFSPIIAQMIQLALSRTREFLADSDAALLTRYPQGLIGALEKISKQETMLGNSNGVMNHIYICDPVKSYVGNKSFFGDLFSTHPSVEKRIEKLKSMIK